MKTLLVLTTTVLSLAVLTGCKKETYGDPMKFAQKYLLKEMMSPGYKASVLGIQETKDIPLKNLMDMQGYTGFDILSARLTSTSFGEEVVECTVGIKTSGKYKYYSYGKHVSSYDFDIQGSRGNRIEIPPSENEKDEALVSRLKQIDEAELRFFKPLPMPPPFRAMVARRQVDGVYIPVGSCEGGHIRGDANWMWSLDFYEDRHSLSTNDVVTSEQIKATPNYFILGTPEQIEAYNTYSQQVIQAKLLSTEICKRHARLRNINKTLENKGWRRVEGEERIKLEKEQKEVMQTLGELKKQVLTL